MICLIPKFSVTTTRDMNLGLKMGRGAVIVLDRAPEDPIEIRANNHLIARGEIVIVEDRLGVCITESVAAEAARQHG